MLAEVEAGGEPRAGAGQHDGGLRVVAFEPVECLVQVGEEGAVLRVDRVGRHRHDGDAAPPLDRPAHARSSSFPGSGWCEGTGGRPPRPGRSLRVMPACRSRISWPPACSMIGSRSRRGRCPPLPAAPGRPVVWPGSGSSHGPEW
jgi:hypothetical protein